MKENDKKGIIVYHAFKPEKLNYELLGAGRGAEEFRPGAEELEDLKSRLNTELDRLLDV